MSDLKLDPLKGERKEDILSNKDVQDAIRYGVMPDDLNYKKLFGYTFIGIVVVLALLLIALQLFRFAAFQSSQQAAINAEFYELNELREKHHHELTTFESVDNESGTFRIPIDSAMTLTVEDYN
jgi:hypothetical protein